MKDPPDGGLVGWLAVAGAFLLQFSTIGYMTTWNVFEEHYNHVTLTDSDPAAVRGGLEVFNYFLPLLCHYRLQSLQMLATSLTSSWLARVFF